jgi:chitodextrinase
MQALFFRCFLLWFFSLSINALAVNCANVAQFSNTTKTEYVSGSYVRHNSSVYKCLVAGWCNIAYVDDGLDKLDPVDDFVFGHAEPYIPGNGWAWSNAWQYAGECDCSIQSVSSSGYSMCITSLKADEDPKINNIVNLDKIRNQLLASTDLPQSVTPGNVDNPDNVKRVERIVSINKWRSFFPLADASYTYHNFLKSVALFPYFCKLYDTEANSERICRKSLATLFAHIAFESGSNDPSISTPEWRQGLKYTREQYTPSPNAPSTSCSEFGIGCENNSDCSNSDIAAKVWPCGRMSLSSYVKYFGRGAIPIKSRADYAFFSEVIFRDPKVLLKNPGDVADEYLNIATAIYSFLKPYTPGPSMAHLIDGTWIPNQRDRDAGIVPGFGATINLKHNTSACSSGTETNTSRKLGTYYRAFSSELQNIITGEQLTCNNMQYFSTMGNGLATYWDKSFFDNPNNPDGKAFACLRVPYKTPFSIFDKELRPSSGTYPGFRDGYNNCVINHYDVIRVY